MRCGYCEFTKFFNVFTEFESYEHESVKLIETDASDEAALARFGLKDLDKPKTQPSPTE